MNELKPTQQMFADETPAETEKAEVAILNDGIVSNILDLPSKGQLGYPATIGYRDIYVKDEEVLSAATPDTYARTLNKVLKSICNDCEYFDQITSFDRDFLLVYMWAYNYSPTKKVELKCPSCSHEFSHVIDFTKQEIIEINERFKGYFELEVKKAKTKVRVRLNTVGDENLAEQYIMKNKDQQFENVMMALSIDFGVEGLPVEGRVKWVRENVSGAEMAKIKKFHSLFKYGLKSDIDYVCPECSEAFHSPFPFSAEDILFPTISADIEEFL